MSNTRIFKFRVWDTLNRKMVYEPYRFVPAPSHWKDYPDEKFHVGHEYFVDHEDEINGIDRPCEVMQFTGKVDKNGVGIWEGDIIEFSYYEGDTPTRLTIVFAQAYACEALTPYKLDGEPWDFYGGWPHEELKVIGNVYETPELILE